MARTALAERDWTGLAVAPDPEDDYEKLRRADLRQRLVLAGVPLIETLETHVAGTPDRDILSDLAYEIETYLRGLSVPQLVCLAYGHRWPELVPVPGGRAPKGFRAVLSPQRNGVFLITELCTRSVVTGTGRGKVKQSCGTVRKSQTLPGNIRGLFDRKHMRNYAYDGDEWEKRPEGSKLTRIDFLDEIFRRMGRELFAAEYEGNEDA